MLVVRDQAVEEAVMVGKGVNGHVMFPVPKQDREYWKREIETAAMLIRQNPEDFSEETVDKLNAVRDEFVKRQAVSPFDEGDMELLMRELHQEMVH